MAPAATPGTPIEEAETPRAAKEDYRIILGSGVFWVMNVSLFLCLLMTQLHSSQMNVMLIDNDISAQTAANIVPIYALGTIVGRIACGLALDRYATPIVTSVSMILPALGLFLLATDLNTVPVIGFAMFSFLLVLAFRAYQTLDADNTDTMRVAEPVDEPNPPLSY